MVGRPFPKGQSGNPGGRPRSLAEIRELAQQHGTAAFRRVLELMTSKNPRVALAAAQEVLNRAYGKPSQAHAHTGPDGGPIEHAHHVEMTDAERRRRIHAILDLARGRQAASGFPTQQLSHENSPVGSGTAKLIDAE